MWRFGNNETTNRKQAPFRLFTIAHKHQKPQVCLGYNQGSDFPLLVAITAIKRDEERRKVREEGGRGGAAGGGEGGQAVAARFYLVGHKRLLVVNINEHILRY